MLFDFLFILSIIDKLYYMNDKVIYSLVYLITYELFQLSASLKIKNYLLINILRKFNNYMSIYYDAIDVLKITKDFEFYIKQ